MDVSGKLLADVISNIQNRKEIPELQNKAFAGGYFEYHDQSLAAKQTYGKASIRSEDAHNIDEDTLFNEGEISHIRIAGLIYILAQEGLLDVDTNARQLFNGPDMKEFLQAKFGPHERVKIVELINNLFGDKNSQSSKLATIADLTSGHAAITDISAEQLAKFKREGITKKYSLFELLTPAQKQKKPTGVYGQYQPNNTSYFLLGFIIEQVCYKLAKQRSPEQEPKLADIAKILQEKMSKITILTSEEIKEKNKVIESTHVETINGKQRVVNASEFSAGYVNGFFTSADNLAQDMYDFFLGFPGTAEYGQDANPYFTDETIKKMQKQWQKHPPQEIDGILRYGAPGFEIDVDAETTEIIYYHQEGQVFGSQTQVYFDPETGKVIITNLAYEGVTLAPGFAIEKEIDRFPELKKLNLKVLKGIKQQTVRGSERPSYLPDGAEVKVRYNKGKKGHYR